MSQFFLIYLFQDMQMQKFINVIMRNVQDQDVIYLEDQAKMIRFLVYDQFALDDFNLYVMYPLLIVQVMIFLWQLC